MISSQLNIGDDLILRNVIQETVSIMFWFGRLNRTVGPMRAYGVRIRVSRDSECLC